MTFRVRSYGVIHPKWPGRGGGTSLPVMLYADCLLTWAFAHYWLYSCARAHCRCKLSFSYSIFFYFDCSRQSVAASRWDNMLPGTACTVQYRTIGGVFFTASMITHSIPLPCF